MIDDPDIGALRLLATAVREGSISAAAREARVTQDMPKGCASARPSATARGMMSLPKSWLEFGSAASSIKCCFK